LTAIQIKQNIEHLKALEFGEIYGSISEAVTEKEGCQSWGVLHEIAMSYLKQSFDERRSMEDWMVSQAKKEAKKGK
jgi:hypothetical protein